MDEIAEAFDALLVLIKVRRNELILSLAIAKNRNLFKREIICIDLQLLDTVEYDYPKFHLSMDCFICNVKSGDLILKEHEAAKWLTKETLYSVDWLPADQALIGKIEKYLEEHA